jgi:endonuclease YncB( thermonuclease family)
MTGKMPSKQKITASWLRARNVPRVFIAGILLTLAVGAGNIGKIKDYYKYRRVFPVTGIVREVVDGDTFDLQNGTRVRMNGINAPERGEKNFEEASNKLSSEVLNKRVWLEYDRDQEDRDGRVLAWVWTNCEAKPEFLPEDYMFLNKRQSKPGLTTNPEGCLKGKLVQEELLKAGMVKIEVYKDRGKLKYEERIGKLNK